MSEALHDPGGKVRVRWPADSEIHARFSECGRYRWELTELWDDRLPLWLWVLMNPSTADVLMTDPTVAKTGRMARLGGAGGQIITNVGAYRSTDPKGLLAVKDPIGRENLDTIRWLACRANVGKVIMAYGKGPAPLRGAGLRIARELHACGLTLHVLRLSQDGTPMHPLSRGKGFIPIDTQPMEWIP